MITVHQWEHREEYDEETGRTMSIRVPVEYTETWEPVTKAEPVTPCVGICAKCGKVAELFVTLWDDTEVCAGCVSQMRDTTSVVS